MAVRLNIIPVDESPFRTIDPLQRSVYFVLLVKTDLYPPNSNLSSLLSMTDLLLLCRIGAFEGPRYADLIDGREEQCLAIVAFCECLYSVVYVTHIESLSALKADTRRRTCGRSSKSIRGVRLSYEKSSSNLATTSIFAPYTVSVSHPHFALRVKRCGRE
jgi:hypothetical protein